MTHCWKAVNAFCAAMALFALTSTAIAASPSEFIRLAGDRTFQSLGDNGITEIERQKRFRSILTEIFDIPTIGQFVLGRYWRVTTDKQKTEYLNLFEEFVVQAYSNRFKELGDKKFAVGNTQPLSEEDTMVLTEISESKGPPIRVNWRVRNLPQGLKVVDVQVEGVSMSITQRDEFASVIRNRGGTIEGLLTALREKTGMRN